MDRAGERRDRSSHRLDPRDRRKRSRTRPLLVPGRRRDLLRFRARWLRLHLGQTSGSRDQETGRRALRRPSFSFLPPVPPARRRRQSSHRPISRRQSNGFLPKRSNRQYLALRNPPPPLEPLLLCCGAPERKETEKWPKRRKLRRPTRRPPRRSPPRKPQKRPP